MKETKITWIRDSITVWGVGDVTHTPQVPAIDLDENKWKIGQKVMVTIESIEELQIDSQTRG